MKKHIPNTITLLNLLCGGLAIVYTFEGNLVVASFLVGAALIFDFFDGFAARMLGVSSPIGKELDSLADLVTFGAVPTFQMYEIMKQLLSKIETTDSGITMTVPAQVTTHPILLAPFAILLFSALRLAKFNVDTKQSDSFIGLPTPSCAMVICSIPLMLHYDQSGMFEMLYHPIVLAITSMVMALLLVMPLPLLSLKFKNYRIADNIMRYILVASAILFMVIFKYAGLPLTIVFYIILSLINNFTISSNNT